jgi:hypothetical protein
MYNFTRIELDTIHDMMEINGGFVRPAYRWHQGGATDAEVDTNDVEDWVIAFYHAYNKIFPGTY